jgi:hypothetical protein
MEKPETDKVDLEYYEVLEVTKEATKGEIKKAYFMKVINRDITILWMKNIRDYRKDTRIQLFI